MKYRIITYRNMIKSTYHIKGMDCPSEENLIRVNLENIPGIIDLRFDLNNGILTVFHKEEDPEIDQRIHSLNLGSQLKERSFTDKPEPSADSFHKKLLWWVLGINLFFFFAESIFGVLSKSMGLVADSLDMFSDAVVYGLSIWAVGTAVSTKRKVAKISGYFQILLALAGFAEILRRIFFEQVLPDYQTMIWVSALALTGNAASMYILNKTDSKDANIVASKIFTSNDVIINLGVIAAGLLVMLTRSLIPDLIVGTVVFVIVIRGALRILKLR